MITCDFFGGLGNNLFQLAQVYSIHKLYGVDLIIPSFTSRPGAEQVKQSPNLEFSQLFENKFQYTNTPLIGIQKYTHVDCNRPTDNKLYHYTEVPLYDNICYTGYFQSEKYFLGVDLSKELILKKENIKTILSTYPEFFGQNIKQNISLHYRLGGDRVMERMKPFHPNVSVDFYVKAIESLEDYSPEKYNILVFSDNTNHCKLLMENFPYPVTFIPRQTNVLDFTMMSLCDINIVGNSTFGWWAAYMNQHPHKKVLVTESEWLGPGYASWNLKDVFPGSWDRFIIDKNGNYIKK